MKKFLKIFFASLAGIIVLLLVLPFFFIGKIEKRVKEEVNKQINATVGWEKISLSLFKSFPDLNIGVDKLFVVGVDKFEGDTLAAMDKLAVAVDIMSAIKGDVNIKEILIQRPLINLIVDSDTVSVNWDIMKPSTEPEIPVDTAASSGFMANLQHLTLEDGRLYYIDRSMKLVTSIEGLTASLSGDLGASSTDLMVDAVINRFGLTMEESTYMKGVKMAAKTNLISDLDNMVFTFKNSDLWINQLAMGIDGSFGLKEEGYDLDMRIFAKETDFKAVLGLFPEEMLKDIQSIKTTGKIALEATLKGLYVDTDNVPSFDLNFVVSDGSLKYPDLPESITDIQINTRITNPGGSLDGTITDISRFHFALAKNPFDASLNVITPMSNATFKGAMKGAIDLLSLKKALPLDSMEMKGLITADIRLAGDYQMIEKELYEKIQAEGHMQLNGFEFRSTDLPFPYFIDKASMKFSPRYLELSTFNSRLGNSDIDLNGRLENYLSYFLKDGVLKGNLSHQSKFLDTNELMALSGDETTEVADTSTMKPVIIPKNIDFVLASTIDKMVYDKLNITNASGKIVVRDGRILLDGLNLNLLGGKMLMSGQYNTQDPKKPFVDFNFDASKININMAANSFSIFDSMLPIAKLAQGLVSAKFTYSGLLGDDMKPVLSSVMGLGDLRSEGIEIQGSKFQSGLVSMLKDQKYEKLQVSDFLAKFKLENGNLIVSPFDAKMLGKTITFQGNQSIDQKMNYSMQMPFSRQELSGMAGLLGMSVSGKGEDLPVEILIKGTLTKPDLSINLEKAKAQLKNELGQEAEKAADKLLADPNVKKGVEDLKSKFKKIVK
jgi:uncharacterized protein involved in outer membrane biogenesis